MNSPHPTSTHEPVKDVPRGLLIAAGLMIATSITLAAVSRQTGFGEAVEQIGAVAAERQLRFEDQTDGGIAIYDAANQRLIERIAPGSNGFLRGTLRGLNRERKRENVARELAYELVGTTDGHLLLIDPQTRRRIDLGSFGPTNAAVFTRLLRAPAVVADNRSIPS